MSERYLVELSAITTLGQDLVENDMRVFADQLKPYPLTRPLVPVASASNEELPPELRHCDTVGFQLVLHCLEQGKHPL